VNKHVLVEEVLKPADENFCLLVWSQEDQICSLITFGQGKVPRETLPRNLVAQGLLFVYPQADLLQLSSMKGDEPVFVAPKLTSCRREKLSA